MDDVSLRQEIDALQAIVEMYRTRCNILTTELYQVLMTYCVFEGVLFTAVATAAKLTCQTSLLPALLSLLTSIVTAWGVHLKLNLFEDEKGKLIRQELIVWDRKELLDEDLDVPTIPLQRRRCKEEDKSDEDLNKSHEDMNKSDEDLKKSDKDLKKSEEVLKKKLADEKYSHRWTYGIIMTCLSIYSLLLLACCIIPLCWDQDRSFIMLCAFNRCWEKPYTLHIGTF